jgi:hypothetical protein
MQGGSESALDAEIGDRGKRSLLFRIAQDIDRPNRAVSKPQSGVPRVLSGIGLSQVGANPIQPVVGRTA